MNTHGLLTTILVLIGLVSPSVCLPTNDFLFSRFFEGESNCTGQAAVGTYGVFTPLGCIASGANSQLRQCNGTHYVVNSCTGTTCSSNCIETSSVPLNQCDSGATLRTCQPITEDLIPSNALLKVVWDQPGECNRPDFASIMIYYEDNECFNTNSSFTEFFDFVCNSTTGQLTQYYHSTTWCDSLVREELVSGDRICLTTLNDRYSSNTLIGCSLSTLFNELSGSPAANPPNFTPSAPATPITNSPSRNNQPSSTSGTATERCGVPVVIFTALTLISLAF